MRLPSLGKAHARATGARRLLSIAMRPFPLSTPARAPTVPAGARIPSLTMSENADPLASAARTAFAPIRSPVRHRCLLHPRRGNRPRRHRRRPVLPLPHRLRATAGGRERRRLVHDRRHAHPTRPRRSALTGAPPPAAQRLPPGSSSTCVPVVKQSASGAVRAREGTGGRRSSSASSDHWKRLLRRPAREPVALDAQSFVDELNRRLRADPAWREDTRFVVAGGDAGATAPDLGRARRDEAGRRPHRQERDRRVRGGAAVPVRPLARAARRAREPARRPP